MERFSTFSQTLLTESKVGGEHFKIVALAQKAYQDQIEADGGEHRSGPADHLLDYVEAHKRLYDMKHNKGPFTSKHRFDDHYDPNKPNMGNPHKSHGPKSKKGQINLHGADQLRDMAKDKVGIRWLQHDPGDVMDKLYKHFDS